MTPQLLTAVVVVPTVSGRTPPSKNAVRMAWGRVSVPRAVIVGAEEVEEVREVREVKEVGEIEEVGEVEEATGFDGAADTSRRAAGASTRATRRKRTAR